MSAIARILDFLHISVFFSFVHGNFFLFDTLQGGKSSASFLNSLVRIFRVVFVRLVSHYILLYIVFCVQDVIKKILSAHLSSTTSYVLFFSCRNFFLPLWRKRRGPGLCVCVRVSCTLACLTQWHILKRSSMKECFTEIFHSSVTFYRQSLQYYSQKL